MKSMLTIESLRRDFDNWREARVSHERMPEDLVRAAAVLAEQTSVAKVAKHLNINHTRISHAVALLRNERLALLPTSSRTDEHEDVPAGKNLTFTKVEPPADPAPPPSSAHSEFSESGSLA